MREPHRPVGVRALRQNLSVYLRRVKAGEAIEVSERGQRVAVLVPRAAARTPLERLVESGRATAAEGDVLALGPPLGRRPSRRASRALERQREES